MSCVTSRAETQPPRPSLILVRALSGLGETFGVRSLRQLYPEPDADVDPQDVYAFPAGSGRWVRAMFVSSVDGAASVDGRSGGLGNVTDREIFAVLRGLADAVLIGAGTARAERYGPVEPSPLWAEQRVGRPPTPPVAIVSRSLAFDLTGPLFTAAPPQARTIVLTCEAASEARIRDVRRVADVIVAGGEQVEPAVALDGLAERGLRRVSCEGGPRLLAGIAAAGCLDELCLTLSPVLLGGDAPRITHGGALASRLDLELAAVLEDEGYLFLRYVRRLGSS